MPTVQGTNDITLNTATLKALLWVRERRTMGTAVEPLNFSPTQESIPMSDTALTAERPAFGCYKNTIRLRSGRYFDLRDPQPDQFTLGDIAGALSKICRFGGQIDRFYSVAEHCVHCMRQAVADGRSREIQAAVLLHDAAEAFCGDVVKPLKVMLPEYGAIEDRVEAVIAEKFGIDPAHASVVKEIDMAMLIAERRFLFSADAVEWTGERSVRRLEFLPGLWTPDAAEKIFMYSAAKLGLDGRSRR